MKILDLVMAKAKDAEMKDNALKNSNPEHFDYNTASFFKTPITFDALESFSPTDKESYDAHLLANDINAEEFLEAFKSFFPPKAGEKICIKRTGEGVETEWKVSRPTDFASKEFSGDPQTEEVDGDEIPF